MIAQGKMGEVDWIITDDGELIIGKEGETQTFEYASSRIDSSWGWNSFRERILSISFKGQVNGNGSHKSMFEDCKSLTSLDLSNFDTSNVTSMADMFYDCEKLISLDLNNFNTSGVTNMTGMFDHCQSLTSLDLSGFNTSSVTNMKFMFANCEKLISLDLNNFNTSSVINMAAMFYNCQSLISLDLSSFNTSSITNMDSVFHDCKKLETIYVSSLWNINQVHSSIKMFSNCLKIVGLYETTYDSSKIDKTYARIDSSSQKGYLSSYIERGVYDNVDWLIDSRYRLFIGKAGEEQTFINRDRRNNYDWPWYESYSIYITSISFSGLVNGNGSHTDMFYNCQLLTSLDLNNFNTSNITSMKGMFSDCCSLTSLDFSGFNTSSVTDMSYMFYHCYVLAPLNLSKFDTPNVTSMNSMFYYCSLLTSLDLSNFNTSKVKDMNFMFGHCERLTTLDVSHFDTSIVTAMRYMFSDCNRLTSLNLSNFNTSSVTDMKYMFNNCESLVSLDLSSFDISNVTNMYRMFYNCPASINIFYVSNCSTQQGGTEDIDVTDIFTNSGEIFLMRPANVTNPTGVKNFWREVAATNSKVHFEYDDTSAPTAMINTQRGKFETKEEEGVTTTVFVENDSSGDVIKITPNTSIKQDNIPDPTKVGENTLTNITPILNNGDYIDFTKLKLNGDSFESDTEFIQYIINKKSFCIRLNSASESQYLLELDICDRREDSTFPFKVLIPGVFAMIEFRKGGHGMSIGKICEQDGLEISIPTAIGEGLFPPTQPNNPQLVVDPSGDLNPSEQGWYEHDPIKQKYYKTIDTIVNNQKSYYEAEEEKIDLNNYQLIIGQYNEKSDDGILVVGNGTKEEKSNSFIIDKNGDFRIKDRFRIKDEDKNNASFLDMEILEKKEKFYNFIDKEEFGYPRHKPKEDPFTQTITFDCPKIALQESLENKFYIAIYINHYAFTYGEYELTSKTLIEEYFIEKGVPITQENFSYDGNTTIEYEVESIPNMTGSSLRLEFNVSYCVENRVPAFNFGINNSAEGKASSVFGTSLESSGDYSFTIGKYNALIPYSASSDNLKYAFVIGNGENEEGQITRSNALTVDWQGKIDISGTPYSSSWVQQRDFAQIKRSTIPNSNGMFPFVDAKTPSGDWAIATYGEGFYVSYVTDVDYDSGTNTQTAVLSISNSGAVNASGQYQVHGRPYISTELKSWDNVTIAKGAFSQFSYSVEKAGYTPIGVAGFDIDSASSSGAQVNNVWFGACRLSGNNVIFQLRNHNDSTAAKVKLWAAILYRAT